MWYIRAGRTTSLGVVTPNLHEAKTITLARSARGYPVAAMTVEPAPDGSPKPTSAPFVAANLSS
jgi:hypothetical protein